MSVSLFAIAILQRPVCDEHACGPAIGMLAGSAIGMRPTPGLLHVEHADPMQLRTTAKAALGHRL